MAALTLVPSSPIQSMPDIPLFPRCHPMGGVRKKDKKHKVVMVVRNDLSHQRIHSCFVGSESWMQFFPIAGLPSEQPHSQTYNWPWVSCRPNKAQIIFCCLHSSGMCVLRFPIVQTRTLTGLNNSIASKQIQSISVSRMSVSHITHHWLPIHSKQIQEETPAMKIPIWAKESLV